MNPAQGLQPGDLEDAILGPELWPITLETNLPPGVNPVSALLLSGIETNDRMVEVSDFLTQQNANVQGTIQVSAQDTLNYLPNQYVAGIDPGNRQVTASYLNLTFQNNSAALIASYLSMMGLWIWKPTVVDKLAFAPQAVPLDQQVGAAAAAAYMRQLQANPFLDSLRPERMADLVRREYVPLKRWVYTPTAQTAATLEASNVSVDLIDVFPGNRGADFCVLENIWMSSGAGPLVDAALLNITRDNVLIISEPLYPLSLASTTLPPFGVPCWIPALNQLRVSVVTQVNGSTISPFNFRLTVGFYRLTPIIRARWALTAPRAVSVSNIEGAANYVPPEVQDAVLAGWQ